MKNIFSFLKKRKVLIEIKNGNLFINNTIIQFPMKLDDLVSVLGKYDKRESVYDNLVWDKLGLWATENPYQKIIENINIDPRKTNSTQVLFQNEDIISYFNRYPAKRCSLSYRNKLNALLDNEVSVALHFETGIVGIGNVSCITISNEKKFNPNKYDIKPLDEEVIEFKDFGFKLSIVQELMYAHRILKPEFDLYEFVELYDKRKIDIEEEGYEPIEEVTQWFEDLPIPKRLAHHITEIEQDGGNTIYLELLRFGMGDEDYWDIRSTDDLKHFPNLKKACLCYASEEAIKEFIEKGVEVT